MTPRRKRHRMRARRWRIEYQRSVLSGIVFTRYLLRDPVTGIYDWNKL